MPKEKLFSVTANDCDWDFFRGSGAGGQKKNKTSSACRCTHRESGAVGRAQDGRSQVHNKRLAFRRMSETKEFKAWLKIRIARAVGDSAEAEAYAEREVNSDRVCVEVKDGSGNWVQEGARA